MAPKKATKAATKSKTTSKASPRKETPSGSKVAKKSPTKKSTTSTRVAASEKSPTKSTSPAKAAAKSDMAPATRRSSAGTKSTTKAATKATKATKKAGQSADATSTGKPERSFIDDETDGVRDGEQSTEDIIDEIGRRRLTKIDKELIAVIQEWESGKGQYYDRYVHQRQVHRYEAAAREQGKPVNCHAKIYWRFRRRFEAVSGMEYELDRIGRWCMEQEDKEANEKAAGSNAASSKTSKRSVSPAKTSAARRSVSKSPTKSVSRARSASPVKARMTRPVRESSEKPAPKVPSRATKVTKAKSSKTPTQATLEAHLNANDHRGRLLRVFENLAYAGEKFGRGSEEHGQVRRRTLHLGQTIPSVEYPDHEDIEYASDKGRERAEDEMALQEQADQGEQGLTPDAGPDYVDGNGIVMNQRPASRPGAKMTRPTASPSPRKTSSGSTAARRSPTKAPAKTAALEPLPAGQPSKEGHGFLRSPTNPEFLMRDGKPFKKNTFFETMPSKEVWHRNMPHYFSIGETPYMEKMISQQIDEDLGRSHGDDDPKEAAPPQPSSWFTLPSFNIFGKGNASSAKPTSVAAKTLEEAVDDAEDKILTMWNLPPLTQDEIDASQKSQAKKPSRVSKR